MIIDSKLEFSDAQSVSGSASATVTSTNVRDLGTGQTDAFGTSITPDIGEGGKLVWHVRVNTAMVGSSATVTASLVSKASSASISSGGTTHVSHTFAAKSAAGTDYQVAVPSGTINRYVGVLYSIAGAKLTSSKFDSFLNLDHERID